MIRCQEMKSYYMRSLISKGLTSIVRIVSINIQIQKIGLKKYIIKKNLLKRATLFVVSVKRNWQPWAEAGKKYFFP